MLALIERIGRVFRPQPPEVQIEEDPQEFKEFLARHPNIEKKLAKSDERYIYLKTAIALENALQIDNVASRFLFDSKGERLLTFLRFVYLQQSTRDEIVINERFVDLFTRFCTVHFYAIQYENDAALSTDEVYLEVAQKYDYSETVLCFYKLAELDSQYQLLSADSSVVILDLVRQREEDDLETIIEETRECYERVVSVLSREELVALRGTLTIDTIILVAGDKDLLTTAFIEAASQKSLDPIGTGNTFKSIAMYAQSTGHLVLERTQFLEHLKTVFYRNLRRRDKKEFDALPAHKQQYLLRSFLAQNTHLFKDSFLEHGKPIEVLTAQQLSTVRLVEDSYYPYARIGTSLGFEIEFEIPDWDPSGVGINGTFDVFDALGLKKGSIGDSDCLETSPGPFNSPTAGVLVLEVLLKMGLIDLDSTIGQALHLNVGIDTDNSFAPSLVQRLCQISHLTGLAYSPTLVRFDIAKYPRNIMVYPKKSGSNYYEVKDFTVLGVEALVQAWMQFGWLAWAANAYNKIQVHSSLPIPTLADIKGAPFCASIKDLARIWRDLNMDLLQGFRQVGIPSGNLGMYLGEHDYHSVAKVREEVALVYPKASYAGIADISEIRGTKIKHDGGDYLNIVCFVQALVKQAVCKVEAIADRTHKDTIRTLKRVNEQGVDNSQELIGKFLRRYGYAEASSPFEIQKMVVEYLIKLHQDTSIL